MAWARLSPRQRQLVPPAFLEQLRREAAKEINLSNTITPMWTRQHAAAEAERITQARAGACDSAAVAMAELCRQARGRLYEAITGARHGLTLEECASVIDNETLARALLGAMQTDGEVSEYQGIYSVTFKGAA